jgi:hypothetical protein
MKALLFRRSLTGHVRFLEPCLHCFPASGLTNRHNKTAKNKNPAVAGFLLDFLFFWSFSGAARWLDTWREVLCFRTTDERGRSSSSTFS